MTPKPIACDLIDSVDGLLEGARYLIRGPLFSDESVTFFAGPG
ncbi:MAG TPA: hypothetical protein VMK12_21180 [Anaeromyxobacteraceae bacterium]|nr:hypothetical protein [Anaeromyxobacteraceae bacterium]